MSEIKLETIDRKIKLPIYKQIYTILDHELENGVYDEVEILPSEKELCDRFDVERNTVRKALQLFVDEGRVKKMPGYGTKILRGEEQLERTPEKRVKIHDNILMLTRESNPLGNKNVESFHLKLMWLLEQNFSEMGYNLVFKMLSPHTTLEEIVAFTHPVAVVFDSYFPSHYYQQALQLGIPCISINHYTPWLLSVVSNNFDGAYRAAERLTDAGHRRIALIIGKSEYQTSMERLSGVQSLYQAKGLVLDPSYVFSGSWLFEFGAAVGEKILAMPKEKRPTAVFAFNDDLAYGCLSTLEKHGVRVPEEISLIGFDRSERYEAVFRPIDTVDVSIEAMVQYACWYLHSLFEGRSPKALAKLQVATTLIENGTVTELSPVDREE